MTTASSAAKLHHDVLSYETGSDRKIAPENYYIVKIQLLKKRISLEEMKDILKEESSFIFDKERPIGVFIFKDIIYIVFSSLESGSHYMEGSHHSICSTFTSKYSLKYDCSVLCSIVELDARIKVLIYFQTKIYEGARHYALKMMKKNDESTLSELISILNQKSKSWDKVESYKKYGLFYKCIDLDRKKFVYYSDFVNAENLEKFRRFLFG